VEALASYGAHVKMQRPETTKFMLNRNW